MRQVVSLSLQPDIIKDLKTKAKTRGFGSLSSYVSYLAELDNDLISETELWNSVRQARQEYKQGKTLQADSIEDLLEKHGGK